MNVGVMSDRTSHESRVCLAPAAVNNLILRGHRVLVESGAGARARFADEDYERSGARILYDREELIGRSDLVVKVSPLQPTDAEMLRERQTVLAFHHLAAARRDLVETLRDRGCTLIGFEVIEDAMGGLPILRSMSEIAGQLAVHVAAHALETREGGRGILLGGATGIPAAHVVILGAGTVGLWAARTAMGNGAQVMLLDSRIQALRRAGDALGRGAVTELADKRSIGRAAGFADVLIGAVLVKGERSPHLVTREMVSAMKPGSVIVDVSIDQGGCVETSRPTTLEDPIYVESGVTHYAVPNMTSAVARTASLAVSHTCFPFVRAIADMGLDLALRDVRGLAAGVYAYRGEMVLEGAARSFSMGCQSLRDLLGMPEDGGLGN